MVPLLALSALGCPLRDEPDLCLENLFVTGELKVDGQSFDFDSATASLAYSEAPGDADCIFEVDLEVRKGSESSLCSLGVRTTPLHDDSGRLVIDRIELSVNGGDCPTWGIPDGFYIAERGDRPLGTIDLNADVQRGDPYDCYDGEITLDLTGFFASDPIINEEIPIDVSTITVAGMTSPFGEMASCPTPE